MNYCTKLKFVNTKNKFFIYVEYKTKQLMNWPTQGLYVILPLDQVPWLICFHCCHVERNFRVSLYIVIYVYYSIFKFYVKVPFCFLCSARRVYKIFSYWHIMIIAMINLIIVIYFSIRYKSAWNLRAPEYYPEPIRYEGIKHSFDISKTALSEINILP